ncbi:MAG: serine O-acetyltransferase [bacterium]|nr:serine O-acetyltransferase [bacterium]
MSKQSLSDLHGNVEPLDPIWQKVRGEAEKIASAETALASFVFATVLNHQQLDQAVCHRLAQQLEHLDVDRGSLRQTFDELLSENPQLGNAFRADISAVFERDPACSRYVEPLLYFKGFHALQTQRLAHLLWQDGRKDLAFFLQSQSSRVFGIDIHPAAQIGCGVFIDHGHAIVVGETAVIGNNVSILHNVTLGGTGKAAGDRHPKIGDHVLIGAGAKILGDINIGCGSRIAAGSVVLTDVPPKTTVAGVPAKVIGAVDCKEPELTMDHTLDSCKDFTGK